EPAHSEAPAPAAAPTAAAPAAPAPAADPPAAAPAAAPPPADLASATRENPLRPQNMPGPAVRDDMGSAPSVGPPRPSALVCPPGFSIEVYASDVPNARSIALGAPGITYVSTRRDKRVYAVVDRNHDHKADKVYTIASDLDVPNGIAYKDGNLYVAQIPRLL